MYLLLFLLLLWTRQSFAALNNVIVLVIDDLSPHYLDPNSKMKNPWTTSILSSKGTNFVNAHSNFPVCGPSRMSFLTGRLPDKTDLFTFERFVPQVPGLSTVMKYMIDNYQYETTGWGKIFHEDKGLNEPYAASFYYAGHWSSFPKGGGGSDGECRNKWFCDHDKEYTCGDYVLSREYTKYLDKRKDKTKPFLSFVGIRKPHLEVGVPKNWFNQANVNGVDNMILSQPDSLGADGEIIPFNKSLSRYECTFEIQNRRVNGERPVPSSKFISDPRYAGALRLIRKYYAVAGTWVDSLIGYIANYIYKSSAYQNNTAIILISDHGFSNGDHGIFCKNALFDQQTRVSLIVAPPLNDVYAERGVKRTQPASLIDLFPTVVHLATGINLGRNAMVDTSGMTLDGQSLYRTTVGGNGLVDGVYVFSTYPRCELVSGAKWQCVIAPVPCARVLNSYMGYAIRTIDQKYVEWKPFNDVSTGCAKPSWPGLLGKFSRRMMAVKQIDVNATGTIWSAPPVQREMYENYPSTPEFLWADWEYENVLTARYGNVADIRRALEFSAAIQWKMDPAFAGAVEPCSGHGYVRLKTPANWNNFSTQPTRADVVCECIAGFQGAECQNIV